MILDRRALVAGAASLAASCTLSAHAATLPSLGLIERRYVYPILGDGRVLTDAVITAGATVLSSASGFTVFDIGRLVTVAGAGPAGVSLNSTIVSISGTSAVLAASAATSVSAASCTVASDHSAALQALINRAAANGGGLIYLPTGLYGLSATLTWASRVGLIGDGAGKSVLKWMASGDMTSAMISGLAGSGTNPYTDCRFSGLEFDGSAATQSSYSVAGKALYIQNMVRPVFDYLYVHDMPATGIGVDFLQDAVFDANVVINCGRLNSGTQPGGAGIGIGVGNASITETYTLTNNHLYFNKTYGVFFETQNSVQTADAQAIVTANTIRVSGTGCGIGDCGLRRFICVGNHIEGASSGGEGITVRPGTLHYSPGISGLIADNIVVSVAGNGISVDYTVQPLAGSKCVYDIKTNKVQNCSGHGIKIVSNATAVLDTVSIADNILVSNLFSGIAFTGAGGVQDAQVNGNGLFNNCAGGSGVALAAIALASPITRLRMVGNTAGDNGAGSQKYGLGVSAAVTGAFLTANDFRFNATGAINLLSGGSLLGSIKSNPGYNPLGPLAVTATASPMTYTAGNTPEQLRINGGMVTAVTKNGITLASSTGTEVDLEPGETVVITYAAAPTLVADRR